MNVHVVVMGYNYPDALEDCLASLAGQSYPDISAVVIDDASRDERCAKITKEWCDRHRWTAILNPKNVGTVRNVWNAIRTVAPAPDDIIVMLDGDDSFPHPDCVSRIVAEYDDAECWLTYGSYESVPYDPACPAVSPYPDDVVEARAFRTHPILYNHPLSFKGFLWAQISEEDLRRSDGEWFRSIYDQVIMVPMLEMAATHWRMIPDVIYRYNTTHPEPDNANLERCETDWRELVGKPVKPAMFLSDGGLCMDWRDRCAVILDYATEYEIATIVETGTADGATAELVALSTAVDSVVTIEADPDRHLRAEERLATQPKITALFGESPGFLTSLAESGLVRGRCLWWLDAHHLIDDVNGDEAKVTPILDEVTHVLERKARDVVLIDDARLFGTYPGYPTLDELADHVAGLGERTGYRYVMTVRHDIIRLVLA